MLILSIMPLHKNRCGHVRVVRKEIVLRQTSCQESTVSSTASTPSVFDHQVNKSSKYLIVGFVTKRGQARAWPDQTDQF